MGIYILPGLNIEYERTLHKNFALAVDIGRDGLLSSYVDLYARWYPWAGMFFADLGLGVWWPEFDAWILRPQISPGIGWRIDIGKPNGWNLITGITGRIVFYKNVERRDSSIYTEESVDFTGKVFFEVGYSF